MPIELIDKIKPKNDGFTGMVDAAQVIGGVGNTLPNAAVASGNVTQHQGSLTIAESQVTNLATDLAGKAASSHTHAESDITNLTTDLGNKVPTSRTVNSKALSSDISLTYTDVGADVSGAAATVQGNLNTHAGLTTTAHGGLVPSNDYRLMDARTPTTHAISHKSGGTDSIKLNEFANPTGDVQFSGYKSLAMACDNGTSFPSTPATGQWFYRSDIKTLFLYEGGWKAIVSFGAVSIYVDKTNGTDAAGKGYSATTGAAKTIQYALGLVPPINGGDVTINITGESYAENVVVNGKMFSGNYRLYLVGATTVSSSGTSSGSNTNAFPITTTQFNDTSKSWTTDAYNNMILKITGGTGSSQEYPFRVIRKTNSNNLYLYGVWDTLPDATSTYQILSCSTTIAPASGVGITVTGGSKGVVLRNLAFGTAMTYNVVVESNSQCFVEGCYSTGNNTTAAVWYNSGSSGRVVGNYMSGTGFGLRLSASSVDVIHNCLICTGTVRAGLYLESGAGQITSSFDFIYGNLFRGGAQGCAFVTINGMALGMKSNEMSYATNSGYGLQISGAGYVRLVGSNLIDHNPNHGIYVTSNSYALVTGGANTTKITNNSGYAIYADRVSIATGCSNIPAGNMTGNTYNTYAADAYTYGVATV